MSKLNAVRMAEFMYPSEQIREFGGIPQNTIYEYVASSFLDGLVNYGSNHVGYLVARYGLRDEHDKQLAVTEDVYQAFANKSTVNPNFKAVGDDWLIMYQTESSYFFLWYDQDCSDCIIERWGKESCSEVGVHTLDEFIAERLLKYEAHPVSCFDAATSQHVQLMVRAAHNPKGWISS